MVDYCIGTSGWHYDDWRGRFYPEKLPKAKWLDYYSGKFSTVELNNTFYRLPNESVFNNWYDTTPLNFVFSVKASRFITHIKRLKECDEAVVKFMSRATLLKEKLGTVLFQLPPGLHRNDGILAEFLQNLPGGIRYVIEFRHESWFEEEIFDLLRQYKIGFCVFDMPKLICPLKATAEFAYIRFHGRDNLYSGCYTNGELSDWAGKITELSTDLESVYIYFNNDIGGHAVRNAITIREYLEKGTSY